MDKLLVFKALERKVEERIQHLQFSLDDAMQATADDSKSTAGDKHETSRAMAHLEQEKLGSQFSEALKLKEMLMKLDLSKENITISLGSLVETSIGWLFLSIGLGQLEVDGKSVFCLTPMAPLGKALLNKKAGEAIDWQGNKIEIISIQ